MKEYRKIFGKAIVKFTTQESNLFRYALSFAMLLALMPCIIIAGIYSSNNSLIIETVEKYAVAFIPDTLIEPFINYVSNKDYGSPLAMVIMIVIAMFAASRIVYSFMLIYAKDEDVKSFGLTIRFRAIEIFLIFISVSALMVYLSTQVAVSTPISFMVWFTILMDIFYRMMSFEKRPLKYGIAGAICCGIGVELTSLLFLNIIKAFTAYDSIYGPLASIVIALLAIYIIACIIYFGYCVNMAFDYHYEVKQFKRARYFLWGDRIMQRVFDKVVKDESKDSKTGN